MGSWGWGRRKKMGEREGGAEGGSSKRIEDEEAGESPALSRHSPQKETL